MHLETHKFSFTVSDMSVNFDQISKLNIPVIKPLNLRSAVQDLSQADRQADRNMDAKVNYVLQQSMIIIIKDSSIRWYDVTSTSRKSFLISSSGSNNSNTGLSITDKFKQSQSRYKDIPLLYHQCTAPWHEIKVLTYLLHGAESFLRN